MEPADWLKYCSYRTSAELFTNLKSLDARESRSLAVILAHLAELDKRRAAAELSSQPTLFGHCTRVLGYSEAEAFLRIRTARQAARFPCILNMIANRRIHLTAVARLAPHLTPENYRSLLDRASRRTTHELDQLVAELGPLPERRPVIRTISTGVPSPATDAAADAEPMLSFSEDRPSCRPPEPLPPPSLPPAPSPASPEPAPIARTSAAPGASSARVLFSFIAGESVRAKFQRAREVLRHKYPAGTPEQIFDAALEALLNWKDPERRLARKEKRRAQRRARQKPRQCLMPIAVDGGG